VRVLLIPFTPSNQKAGHTPAPDGSCIRHSQYPSAWLNPFPFESTLDNRPDRQ
jgi:hypothetical protein